MAYFTDFLASTAEISNLMSILAVLGGLLVMLVFLLKLIYQDIADGAGVGVTKISHRPPQTVMTKVSIPFTLSLVDSCKNANDTFARVGISSKSPYFAKYFWGVKISAFHHVLNAPWPWFYTALLHGNLFGKEHCVESSRLHENSDPQEKDEDLVLKRMTSHSLELGQAPRDTYPLVVVVIRKDSNNIEDLTEVMAVISVFHLKDSSCPIPSQTLCTYMRQMASVTLLRQMFLADYKNGDISDPDSSEDSDPEDVFDMNATKSSIPRCIICQQGRINRVALPCRHANTCSECFDKLQNRCPMCRGFISSFFLLRPEKIKPNKQTSPADSTSTIESPQTVSWSQWFRNWNLWLNTAMGLQEN